MKDFKEFKEVVIFCYERIMKELTMNSSFTLSSSESEDAGFQYFYEYSLAKMFGMNQIANIIESNFNYWFELKDLSSMKYGVNSIRLNWIIGKKSVDRYEKIRNQDNKQFTRFTREIRKKLKINLSNELNKRFSKTTYSFNTSVLPYEEKQKEKFYNQEIGLIWCIENTTLYKVESEFCLFCISKEECKNLLIKKMPNLAKKRKLL